MLAPDLSKLDKESKSQAKKAPATPTITIQQENQEVKQIHSDLTHGCSSIRVFGTGGAGKTAAIRFSKLGIKEAPITTIDTSGVQVEVPGVETLKIGDLSGSGKLRKDNIDPINNFVTDYAAETEFADINIMLMSFSGGSGSVIGPLLVDEILRQKKIAIIIGIVDTESDIDTVNGLNCLRTLNNISDNRKGYVPLILFDNNKGRNTVDRGIDKVLYQLMLVLTVPYIGLDNNDRIKFLSPLVFDTVNHGLKMLSITANENGEMPEDMGLVNPDEKAHEKIDAVMIICKDDSNLRVSKRCSVSYRGMYSGDEGTTLIASIGYQIPKAFIDILNGHIHTFRSTSDPKKSSIDSEYNIGEQGRGGIIL
jgi:hypothetical protein